MRGRIFICGHQEPPRPWGGSLYESSTIGEPEGSCGLLTTLDGGALNTHHHCEMAHQHKVWTSSAGRYDFVGFEHYRRSFFFNPFPAVELERLNPMLFVYWKHTLSHPGDGETWLGPEEFTAYNHWRRDHASSLLQCVIGVMGTHPIVTRRRLPDRMDDFWKRHHPAEWWDLFVSVVVRTKFFRDTFGMIDCGAGDAGYANMYVMRTEIFVEYMAFWEEAMLLLEAALAPAPRIYGFFAERLFNIFVYGKKLRSPNLEIAERQTFLTAKDIFSHDPA